MARAIVTGQVDDAAKWEKGFRTHVELFKKYTATAIYFTTTENEFAILWEVDDPEKFIALVDSKETFDAMEYDGVKRDTVKIHVLDREFDL